MVKRGSGFSYTVRDWLLTSHSTPCRKCEWAILPGLCTNFAPLFEPHFGPGFLRPTDPTCRQFNFRAMSKNVVHCAVALASLGFFWCSLAWWDPDSLLYLYRDLVRDTVRKRVTVHSVSEAAKALVEVRGQTKKILKQITQWWAKQQDGACVKSLGLDAIKLQGLNISSTTSKALRLKSQKFKTVQEISPNGEVLPSDPESFQSRDFKTGTGNVQEMYSNCPGISLDVDLILSALSTESKPQSLQDDVPAQHDSGATHEVAKWQELCDTLAKEALAESKA